MKNRNRVDWMPNRTAWGLVLALFIGIVLGFILWLLFLPMPPLWACAVSWSIGAVGLVIVIAKCLVFSVGFSDEQIVFAKVYRFIRIDRSQIESMEITPPANKSDLEEPWYKVIDRRITFRLRNGKIIEVGPINGVLAYKVDLDVMRKEEV